MLLTPLSMAHAQRIARAGPSKVAKKPSPAVSISWPSKRLELLPDDGVMPLQQLAPAPVAELGRLLGRADDVREEDRREHAVGLRPAARAGQELLDLVDNRIGITGPQRVRVSRQLDELRSRYPLGDERLSSTFTSLSSLR